MNATLRTTLAAATLITAIPAAGIASAHGGKGGDHRGKPARCDRGGGGRGGGRGYEAVGRLADGSSLEQVAGDGTTARGDDRYSGTLVVQVRRGNRRGRQDKGLTSYTVTNVRALGTASGDDPLPAVGTRVELIGRVPKPACVPATTPAPTSPSGDDTTPATTPAPTPSAAKRLSDDGDQSSTPTAGSDYPGSGDDPSSDAGDGTDGTTPTSAAVIKVVIFTGAPRPGGDHAARPVKGHGPVNDDSGDDPSDDSGDDSQGGDSAPEPTPAPTTPRA